MGDASLVREAAHQLKGTAANIGVTEVAALCQQIEITASDPTPADHELLNRIDGALERAADVLRQEVTKPT